MGALAAVSLAGNIFQFLNLIGDAFSKSRQIHAPISVFECCIEVADELLKALKHLVAKGQKTRPQSFRKALKAIWGKEKLKVLEESLPGFRQQMTLHLTVDLRSRIDVLDIQQTESFQALDDATKEGSLKILVALSDSRDHLVVATDAQKEQMKALHTLSLKNMKQQRTRTEVLNDVADAASRHDDAISTEAENISDGIEKANENTRAQITVILDRNQEETKQTINRLQGRLYQLQLETDRKVEDLKEIVIKINIPRAKDRNPERERACLDHDHNGSRPQGLFYPR
ncbi:MAG: hypothetical protein Q9161_001615 [Pseudevernia consocians]